MTTMYFIIHCDCEATQHAFDDAALGARATRGLGDIMAETGTKGTFFVIPRDMQAHAPLYRALRESGHEVGLHTHAADQGYEEFLGIYGYDMQRQIISEGLDVLEQNLQTRPLSFCAGYGSANDHTFPVLEELGVKHGSVSIPTRDLPQCACVWGSSPLGIHYPHRQHRSLVGDVDFVDIPNTLDPDSRMWGGRHPQDLRVELVDAKNHYYTIEKAIKRQLDEGDATPVKYIKACTHNTYDYSDANNFRRQTLLGIIDASRRICDQQGCEFVPATVEHVAQVYRDTVPLPTEGVKLELDTRGRSAAKTS